MTSQNRRTRHSNYFSSRRSEVHSDTRQPRRRQRDRPPALTFETLELRTLLAVGPAVADYQFSNHGLNGAKELFSRDTSANSVASDISSPNALGSTGNGQPSRGLLLGFPFNEISDINPSSGSNDYIQFTISPASGESLDLSLLTFQLRRNDFDSKDSYSVYFDDIIGSGGDNFTSLLHTGQFDSVDMFETVDVVLRDRPEMTDVTSAITFRIYAWGSQGVDALRLDNIRVHEVDAEIRGSTYAYYGGSGKLIRPLDELGNRLADFSAAGYKYGAQPIPDVGSLLAASRIVDVSPGPGDDTDLIQNAIDLVSGFSVGPDGFRGLVQLSAGEFQVNDQITITSSGVVIRGVGDGASASDSTILRATGTTQRSLIVVGNGNDPSHVSSSGQDIVDKYVPVGATSLTVGDASGFAVGLEIRIERPSPANWISDIGMDQIPPKTNGTTGLVQWQPGNFDIYYERVVTRIEGNRIFFNAPVMNSFEQQYGGGRVYELIDRRIEKVGIESIRGKSDFASDTDEDHARTFIQLRSVKDAWVRDITGQHFIYATVHADRESKAITVDGATSLDPKSIITGARRYAFNIEGQFILMQNLWSEEGRHEFVNNSRVFNHGPNVFLNGTAVNSHENSGPHQRWSTGTLYDTVSDDDEFEAIDGGNAGTGHGWRGANMVFWNVTAPGLKMQNPPTAQNWFIGATGEMIKDDRSGVQNSANIDSRNTPIDFNDPDNPTNSLYVAQRNEANLSADTHLAEYVIGDYDLGVYDGVGSVDIVDANPAWEAAIAANTSLPILDSMDGSDLDDILPISFTPQLATNEVIVSALISIGIRNLDDAATGEIWIDSVADRRSFASMGILASPTFNRTQTVTFELTGAELSAFEDGRLDLAVSDAVVDWLNVQLVIGEQTPVIQQTVQHGNRIEAEYYDFGGEGVAYHDTSVGNTGGELRPNDNVDIGANTDGATESYSIGWITDGEWLEYTADVVAGTYDISARVASDNTDPGDLKLRIGNGTSFTDLGTFAVESTGGWDAWETLTLKNIDLSPHAGADQVLRLEMVGSSFNLNWFEFATSITSAPNVTEFVRDGQAPGSPELLARPDQLATIEARFDQDVSISAGDLTVRNLTTGGTAVDYSSVEFSYDMGTRTATWDFNGSLVLDPAYYSFELSDTVIGVDSGLALNDAYLEDIYVAIPGDLNLDGDVDISQIVIGPGGIQNLGDASVLLANLPTASGASYYDGDLNGDGDVDISQIVVGPGEVANVGDASILLANLGQSVVPTSSASSTAAMSTAVLAAHNNATMTEPLGPWESAWHQSVRERLALADTFLTLSGSTPEVHQAVDDFFADPEESVELFDWQDVLLFSETT